MKKFDNLISRIDAFVAMAMDPGEIAKAQQALEPAMKALVAAIKANWNIMPIDIYDQAYTMAGATFDIDTLPDIIQAARVLAMAYTKIPGDNAVVWRKNVSPQAVEVYRTAVQLLNSLRAWRAANPDIKQK